MLLIADGGSTKTNWCVIDKGGKRSQLNSEGYNPYFVDSDYIFSSLSEVLPSDLDKGAVSNIYFYGAGVQNEEKAAVISKALEALFPNSTSFVGHDLLASARALLGFDAGFAAILGTGTNTCLYNGSEITHHIDSGAHILGDEGSGFYIGKRLLIDYLRGRMPADLAQRFKAAYNLTSDEVHDAVYTKPLANRYCAGFSKFIADNYNDYEYSRTLLKDAFNDFFRNIVSLYPGYEKHKFNCIGSVGYQFKDILQEVSTEWGMEFGKVIKAPLEDLVEYHLTKS